MTTPESIQEHREIDLKLGIKSSLPKVRETISLAYLLWGSSGRVANLEYSQSNGDTIQIKDDVAERLKDLLRPTYDTFGIPDDRFINKINENQLFVSQIEPLIVAFELIWRLAKVTFLEQRSFSAERTGRVRYTKQFTFTKNMDVIDLLVTENQDKYMPILLKWATGFEIEIDGAAEEKLVKILMLFSEEAVFKLTSDGTDVLFNLNGVYKKLVDGNDSVNISGELESKGSLRILKSSLSEGINDFLSYSQGNVGLRGDRELDKLSEYQKRVETYLSLCNFKVIVRENEVEVETGPEDDHGHLNLPYNRILFGAPGTGKSHKLEMEKTSFEENYERVTFHPNYSYAQFVGTYKPVPIGREITYKFVPGPFTRTLVKAMKTHTPQLLIIEEINRANVAAVFGDVFQLLDRKNGVSQYPIETSEDLRTYLAFELEPDFSTCEDEAQKRGMINKYQKIMIPDNMYIWATMNSADQGVFPMDTAFKRRWEYEYIGINDGSDAIQSYCITLPNGKQVFWDTLRKELNSILLKSCKVNEDKLVGPFFLGLSALESTEKFNEIFKSKLLMYLFEDAAKQYRKVVFSGCDASTYSNVCIAYDEIGDEIFGLNLQNEGQRESSEDEDV
ncbi:dynein-related subfamily AAA family protein [Fontibacillus phaseoli]|uniref:Dynein-related subfamily AAA family protein n=1 Tax=Fontibacillus phaseoli TaxID=1416533 RepID=A0A369B4Z4_9BACL|nr:AAA family ATPase [Fontibacillus phaseoli]RCX15627.1 dynein-related subfamily AAA family protein [Fontibacillus phaseoli]